MPITTYDSPQGLAPQVGFQPQGFLGGYLWDQRNEDYKQALAQSTLAKNLGLQKEMEEQQTYKLDAPVRAENRLRDITKAQTDVKTYPDIQGGIASDARVRQQTEAQQIQAKMSAIREQLSSDQQKQADRESENYLTLGESLNNISTGMDIGSPEGALALTGRQQAIYANFSKSHPELKLPPTYDQQTQEAVMNKYFAAKQWNKVKTEQAVAKEDEKGRTQLRIAELNRESIERVEANKLRAKQEQLKAAEGRSKTLDQERIRLVQQHALAVKTNNPSLWTEVEQTQYQSILDAINENNRVKVMAGAGVTGSVLEGNPSAAGFGQATQSALPRTMAPAPVQQGQPTTQQPAPAQQLQSEAQAAIAKGADPAKVRARYKQMTGQDLP